jgi:hypothetical protein
MEYPSSVRTSLGARPSAFRFEDLFQSNLLPSLVELVRNLRVSVPMLDDFLVLNVTLDANKVNAEIRWRLGSRQKPWALSGLSEALVAKVLIAYAPPYLEQEIFEHAEEIAADTNSSVEDVLREWQLIRPYIFFYEPGEQRLEIADVADRDDLSYVATQSQLGLPAIYTDDPHLGRMGAPVIAKKIDAELRDYARASSVTIGISLGFGITVAVSIEAVPAVFRLFKSGFDWLRRRPIAQQLLIVGALVLFAMHKRVKARYKQLWHTYGPALMQTLSALLIEYGENALKAKTAVTSLKATIPEGKKRTSLMYARAACAQSNVASDLHAIYRRMCSAGYRTRAAYPMIYLRRILVRSSDFSEASPGNWILSPPKRPFDPYAWPINVTAKSPSTEQIDPSLNQQLH